MNSPLGWASSTMITITMQASETRRHAGVSHRTGDCSGGNSICFSRAIVPPFYGPGSVEGPASGFKPIPGTEREIPAELVTLAMGFLGPQKEGLLEQLGV